MDLFKLFLLDIELHKINWLYFNFLQFAKFFKDLNALFYNLLSK